MLPLVLSSACIDPEDEASQTDTNPEEEASQTDIDPEDDPSQALPPLPEAMNAFGATKVGLEIFISGGHVGRAHENSSEFLRDKQYSLALKPPQPGEKHVPEAQSDWKLLSPLADPTQQLTLFEFEGTLHSLGGLASRSTAQDQEKALFTLAEFRKFDTSTQQWVQLPSMPSTRASHTANLVGETLVVAGGWQLSGPAESGEYHNTWLTIDLGSDDPEWEVHEQPFLLRDHCAGTFGSKVYLLGGMHSGQFPKQPQVYDFSAPERGWQLGPELPTTTPLNGFGCSAASTPDGLYFSAGEGKVFSLNPDELGWTEVATLKETRIFHQLIAFGDHQLIALGGGIGPEVLPLDSVEVISLP